MTSESTAGAASAAPVLVFTVHILDHAGRTIGRYVREWHGDGSSIPERRAAHRRIVENAARKLLDHRIPGMVESDYNIIAGFRVEGP